MHDVNEIDLRDLAQTINFMLPDTMLSLFQDGRTRYGASSKEWQATWRTRMRTDPPALISSYDFEWLPLDGIAKHLHDWVRPDLQGGLKFFPFGCSGAGDLYCLMQQDAAVPCVAYLPHDGATGSVIYGSFDDFVYGRLIESLSDFSHLVVEWEEQGACQCVIADVRHTAAYLPRHTECLLGFCLRPVTHHEVICGHCKKTVPGLIDSEEAAHALATGTTELTGERNFLIKSPWEVGDRLSSLNSDARLALLLHSPGANKAQIISILKPITGLSSIEIKRKLDAGVAWEFFVTTRWKEKDALELRARIMAAGAVCDVVHG